jgi:predicted nucleic acid-binding protein
MKKKKLVLDTNIIIRFLMSDAPLFSTRVKKLFKRAESKSLAISDVVFAEIVYVLLSYYELPKEEIIEKMYALISFEKISCNKKVLRKALEYFSKYSISFADAYMLSLSGETEYEGGYSFNKHLVKISKGTMQEP